MSPRELAQLGEGLAAAARGDAVVLQAGDCAESFAESTPTHIVGMLGLLDQLAAALAERSRVKPIRIGRIGGQYAKPRSRASEHAAGRDLPVFRGHLINSEIPTADSRRHDPARMVIAYARADAIHRLLAQVRAGAVAGPWSSHEALVLDYEEALTRWDEHSGDPYLGSTHLPWIGERTRQPGGAHVLLLAMVKNPVGCKVGPNASPEEIAQVCTALDPMRIPGRLVLIARMGWMTTAERLEAIVPVVRGAGHHPVWLCDPMHGNTVVTSRGLKTRHLSRMAAEVAAFRRTLEQCRVPAGGLHLEVAADAVTECVGGNVPDDDALDSHYTTLCDPRLNPQQAMELIAVW